MFRLPFKKQPIIGIDISDYSIEILQLNKKKEIITYARTDLEEGIVRGGEILNKEKLATKLKETLENARLKSLKAKSYKLKAILSLPESKVFIHHFELPQNLEESALEEKINEKALSIIPFGPVQIYWDYIVIPRTGSPMRHVLFVAVPKKIVDDYVEIIYSLGLEPIILDIESNSLGRALISKTFSKKLIAGLISSMIVDIGSQNTILSIFDSNGFLNLSITVPVAGNTFTKIIATKLKIDTEEAENLKRNFGFEKSKNNEIFLILENIFQDIIKEIKDAIKYYEKNSKEKVKEIILAGGSSLLPGISRYLTEKLQVKVTIGNPLIRIKSVDNLKKDGKNPPVLFANVIGLALRNLDESGINLLKEVEIIKEKKAEFKKRKVYMPLSFLFTIFGLAILGTVVYFYLLKPLVFFTLSRQFPQQEAKPSVLSTVKEATSTKDSAIIKQEESIKEIKEKAIEITITDTPTGWLNVREGPGTNYPIIKKIYPGENYNLLEESGEWIKIKLNEKTNGWVFGRYVIKR